VELGPAIFDFAASRRRHALRQIAKATGPLSHVGGAVLTIACLTPGIYQSFSGGLGIAAFLLALGLSCGGFCWLLTWNRTRSLVAALPELRAEIRHNLAAGNVLQLVLTPGASTWLEELLPQRSSLTSLDRYGAFPRYYLDYCRKAGLPIIQAKASYARREGWHWLTTVVELELAETLAACRDQ
jgi:hypothetical protein